MTKDFQQSLLNVLPLGVWHFPAMLNQAEQEEIREHIREIVRAAPWFTPKMPGGTDFNLKSTCAGAYGWMADGKGFFYARNQPTGRAWPPIPPQIMAAAGKAAQEAGLAPFTPNSCLVSYYASERGRLGIHRDDTKGEDFDSPVISISLGDSAVFGIGGEARTDDMRYIELQSGDVLVMGASGRKLFHQVTRVRKGTSQLLQRGGRISLTLRRVSLLN